ncbi:T9SS type A sorting domain-containing protein [Ilyomonas limi]|uniref:T9SS type A sorting domain-containing protein n=1 Tax=Ilyomonas limi TaxID=2575867 RepID=A0A4U3L8B6_9BACT|nr:T9SS type A sorting domain-containing protein [Ilyomonas limi]TKK69937.1 T9SS type A sorting domain-containing protein [Ilyomonas limi]
MKTCIITLLLACAGLFSLAQNIMQAEYFIDKDKGIGKNTKLNVTLAADSSFAFKINLAGVAPGYHKLYIRTKTSNNKWSFPVRANIEVFPSQTTANITAGEYFFDTDPGVGKGKAIAIGSANTTLTQTFTAKTTGLSPGYHKLYIRMLDSDGHWGLNVRRNIEIIKSLDTAKITKAEYFFNNDPGFGKATGQVFATPSANGTFKFTIPYNKIPARADTLFVRMQDANFTWSLTKLARFSGAPALAPVINNQSLITDANKLSLQQFNVSVSPNPVSGNALTLNIQHTKQTGLQLMVYSLDGKAILSQQFEGAGSFSRQINISTLATGTYVLHISDGLEIRTVQFIKE